MSSAEPSHRNRLNQKQLEILHLIYRFRFVTTKLVAECLGKSSGSAVYARLTNLAEQGYIGRRYEPEYRLRGQHAAYYLLSDGARALRRQPREDYDYSPRTLHNLHKDKDASDQFVDHSLAVMEACCQLKALYGDRLQFSTKSDLAAVEYFPQPLPDAYLRLEHDGKAKQYFLDVHHESQPFFMATRRIKQYAAYANSDLWQITESDLPDILAICDTPTMQKRLQKKMAKEPHAGLNFWITTKDAVSTIGENAEIWQHADKPEQIGDLG